MNDWIICSASKSGYGYQLVYWVPGFGWSSQWDEQSMQPAAQSYEQASVTLQQLPSNGQERYIRRLEEALNYARKYHAARTDS